MTGAASGWAASVDADRVLDGLRELARRTSDVDGAQRVAFTPAWDAARAWLRLQLAGLPVTVVEDDARNLWATLKGERGPALALGSHLDSVPNGGWLDGALGVVAGLEVLRAAGPRPPRSLVLVDWADEEGRFGCSLLGSGASAGTIDHAALRAGGAEAVLDLGRLSGAAAQRPELHGYLELHIEQGPVLEAAGRPLAAVSGTFGVRRDQLVFTGLAAHAGATPLVARHDPVAAAARFVLAAREAARAAGGLATVGVMQAQPATVTAVAARCTLAIDARHADLPALEQLRSRLVEEAEAAAGAERCDVTVQRLMAIDPVAFDAEMVAITAEAAAGVAPAHRPLVSGPLHDAASMARLGVPTSMLFVRSKGGVSHSDAEDTDEDDLRLAARALAATAARAM